MRFFYLYMQQHASQHECFWVSLFPVSWHRMHFWHFVIFWRISTKFDSTFSRFSPHLQHWSSTSKILPFGKKLMLCNSIIGYYFRSKLLFSSKTFKICWATKITQFQLHENRALSGTKMVFLSSKLSIINILKPRFLLFPIIMHSS